MLWGRIHKGSSWFPLRTSGDASFIQKLADTYFLLYLDLMQGLFKL
jgi:hypothetical protein